MGFSFNDDESWWDAAQEELTANIVVSSLTVDLGLPSGNRWATSNLGACSPDDVGLLYEWGRATPENRDNGLDACMQSITRETGDERYSMVRREFDPAAGFVGGGVMACTPTIFDWMELVMLTTCAIEERGGSKCAVFTRKSAPDVSLVIPVVPGAARPGILGWTSCMCEDVGAIAMSAPGLYEAEDVDPDIMVKAFNPSIALPIRPVVYTK